MFNSDKFSKINSSLDFSELLEYRYLTVLGEDPQKYAINNSNKSELTLENRKLKCSVSVSRVDKSHKDFRPYKLDLDIKVYPIPIDYVYHLNLNSLKLMEFTILNDSIIVKTPINYDYSHCYYDGNLTILGYFLTYINVL